MPTIIIDSLTEYWKGKLMTTNVQHQIQADRSGKIWINVSNNDPRLNINGIVARIRPVYNHTVKASQHQTMLKIDGIWTEASMFTHCRMKGSI